MSAGWVSSLWGAADATADIHTPPIDDSEGREAEEAGKCGHGGYEDGNDNAGCGTAPEVRNETTLVNATASTSEGEAATSFSEGLRLTPRGRLLAAALVADSVASTASIFDSLHEDDTDFDTRALRRQTLSDFDKELMAAMPGQAFKDVDVLQSLPKLSRSFGMNVTAMWTAPEHIVDGETYLGSMSAIHNFYFQSQALNSAVSAVPAGASPDRKLSKEILNKLTLTYRSLQELQRRETATLRRRIESEFADVSSALRRSDFYPDGASQTHMSWLREIAADAQSVAERAPASLVSEYKFRPIRKLAGTAE